MDKIFKSQKRLKNYNLNRLAAWLLAVLMLFSALPAGSMTVHAEATDGDVAQMPVYKDTEEYVNADITMQQSPIKIEGDSFELIFRPYFGTSAMNELIAQNGDAARVSIGIRLEWTDAEGNPQSKDFKYTEDMVKTVYAENSGKAFRVIATGIKSFENLTVTPLVKSQVFTSIECLGETEEVTGSVEEAATIVLKKYGDTEVTTKVTGTGIVAIEAEDVIVDKDYVAKKTDEYATNASGKVVARVASGQESDKEEPKPADGSPAIGFVITPDKAGTYYIWARVYRRSKNNTSTDARYIYVSLGNSVYSLKNLQNLATLNDYTWVEFGSISGEANESINVRFRTYQGNLCFDKFIVTTDGALTGTEDIFAVE